MIDAPALWGSIVVGYQRFGLVFRGRLVQIIDIDDSPFWALQVVFLALLLLPRLLFQLLERSTFTCIGSSGRTRFPKGDEALRNDRLFDERG
jgi:hypothetical protein